LLKSQRYFVCIHERLKEFAVDFINFDQNI